jgi:hypothetical protein
VNPAGRAVQASQGATHEQGYARLALTGGEDAGDIAPRSWCDPESAIRVALRMNALYL